MGIIGDEQSVMNNILQIPTFKYITPDGVSVFVPGSEGACFSAIWIELFGNNKEKFMDLSTHSIEFVRQELSKKEGCAVMPRGQR